MTAHTASAPAADIEARRRWLAVLAQAPAGSLQRVAAPALEGHRFDWLRAPETGLVMVRARIGNRGDRFNVGEATLTRCVVRHRDAGGTAWAGIGYVLGRDAEHAARVAQLDALLQQPRQRDALLRDVIEPLAQERDAARRAERARTAATRVRFYALQPT